MNQVYVVENGVQAQERINQLVTTGFSKENIYLFAHNIDRSEHLTEATNTEEVGMKEQGLLDTIGNLFKSRGDELRNRFENLGLTESAASRYEEELDKGKVVVIASTDVK